MKKQTASIIAATLLLSTGATQVFAENAFNGFYAGVSIGGSGTNGSEQVSDTGTISSDGLFQFNALGHTVRGAFSSSDPLGVSSNHAQRKNQFSGAIFAGYSYACEPYYIGAEIFVKGSHYKAKTSSNALFALNVDAFAEVESTTLAAPVSDFDVEASVDAPYTVSSSMRTKLNPVEFGIDLRPGVLLTCDSLLYGRVGVAFNKLRLDVDTTSSVALNASAEVTGDNGAIIIAGGVSRGPFLTETIASRSKKVAAFRIGGGLEQRFCDCLYLRLDYTFTHYGKISTCSDAKRDLARVSIPDTLVAKVALAAAETRKVKVNSSTVQLGLSYYW